MTLFDMVALTALAVSAGVGFFRGAAREMVTVVALLLAAAAAVFGLRLTGPMMRAVVQPDWAGNVAAAILVFVVVYIALRLAGGQLANRIQATEGLGFLDRSIGVGFGLVRALVVLGALVMVFNAATPPERVPRWISGAALYPLTSAVSEVLKALAPQGLDMADRLKPAISDAVRDGTRDPTPEQGYDARERGRIDDLVEKSR